MITHVKYKVPPNDPRKTIAKHITPELLECLEYLYPDQCPSPGTPIDQIMFRSGQASVVRLFKELHAEGQANILESL